MILEKLRTLRRFAYSVLSLSIDDFYALDILFIRLTPAYADGLKKSIGTKDQWAQGG